MKNYAKRRGFTLVELLIVIVVIGILSAMMMLSSTEAVSSAKAAKIINNLRNLKTAALAWYADNVDFVESDEFDNLNAHRAEILKYLGNEEVDDRYQFSDVSNNLGGNDAERGKRVWFIWWECDQWKDKDVLRKLASRGQTVKLRYTNTLKDWQPSSGIFDSTKVDAENFWYKAVGLHILGDFGSEKW